MQEKFKSKIGGQAVIEGIAMRGPQQTCLAVRLPDGTLHTELYPTTQNPTKKIPIVRGAVAMILSLVGGYKYLMKAADYAYPEEAEKAKYDEKAKRKKELDNSWVGVLSGVLGGLLAIVLFMVLPTLITGRLSYLLPLVAFKPVIEGLLKLVLFFGYLFLVTRMKDIHRVFEYHGAEHKTIACYEHGEELTVENVRKYSRFHPRCGTSFLFIVIIVSIIIGSFLPWGNTLVRALLKVLCLPVVMGFSYEIIQYAGTHDNWFARALSAPGLLVQHLTAFEPDDSMIEVGIASLVAVIPEGGEQV